MNVLLSSFFGCGRWTTQAVRPYHAAAFAEPEHPPVAAEELFVENHERRAEFAAVLELAECRVVTWFPWVEHREDSVPLEARRRTRVIEPSIRHAPVLARLSLLVALLGVLSVERLPRLADLLDDAVAVVFFDDTLDLRVVVTGHDHEAVALLDDLSVSGRQKLHLLEARLAVALAMEGGRAGDTVLFDRLLDPFVDTAKDFLVSGCSFGEVHCSSWTAAAPGSAAFVRREATSNTSPRRLPWVTAKGVPAFDPLPIERDWGVTGCAPRRWIPCRGSGRISLDRWGVGTAMYRYRLIDEDGADLGPLISPRVTFAIGQDIVRRAEERYEIVRIVEPENESFHAYLVVRSR